MHSLLFGFALSVSELLFNFYLASLGHAADVAGLFSTVLRVAGVALGIPAGVLIDRFGARRSLIGSMVVYAGSWATMLSFAALPVLLTAQLLVGGAFTVAMAAVVTLLASAVDGRDRARVFGMNASATLIIGLLGNTVGGALPALAALLIRVDPQSVGAYRGGLLAVVVLSLMAIVPLLRLPLPSAAAATFVAASPPQRRLRLWAMLRMSAASMLLGAAGGWILPFQNLYLRQEFGLGDGAIGVALGWIALGMGLGALLGSPMSNWLGGLRAAIVLRALGAPAMLLMVVAPALPVAVVGLVLRGISASASYPLYDSLVMEATPPRQRGMSAGILNLTWALGWALCAAASGFVQVRWGFTPILLASAVCYALSAWSLLTLRPFVTPKS